MSNDSVHLKTSYHPKKYLHSTVQMVNRASAGVDESEVEPLVRYVSCHNGTT